METLNAELDLNKVRLEEESRKLAKVSTDNNGAVENKGRRSKAKANANEADALLMELLGKKATVELGLDKPIVKVFANLASSLIDSRVKSNVHSATILDLQCQLDDKVCVLLLPVPVTLRSTMINGDDEYTNLCFCCTLHTASIHILLIFHFSLCSFFHCALLLLPTDIRMRRNGRKSA